MMMLYTDDDGHEKKGTAMMMMEAEKDGKKNKQMKENLCNEDQRSAEFIEHQHNILLTLSGTMCSIFGDWSC